MVMILDHGGNLLIIVQVQAYIMYKSSILNTYSSFMITKAMCIVFEIHYTVFLKYGNIYVRMSCHNNFSYGRSFIS